jgi:hypothetical protein
MYLELAFSSASAFSFGVHCIDHTDPLLTRSSYVPLIVSWNVLCTRSIQVQKSHDINSTDQLIDQCERNPLLAWAISLPSQHSEVSAKTRFAWIASLETLSAPDPWCLAASSRIHVTLWLFDCPITASRYTPPPSTQWGPAYRYSEGRQSLSTFTINHAVRLVVQPCT